MSIGGSGVTTGTSVYFRMFAIVFAGIMVFGVLISWRAQLLFNAEYVEFPVHRVTKKTAEAQKQKAKKILTPQLEEVSAD